MSNFEEFLEDLKDLCKKYESLSTMIKLEHDHENDIVKIFGEKITALGKAKNGLTDVTELSYATAEHHPYWNILYNSSEITNTVLEKWHDKLSKEDLDEIKWGINELLKELKKIEEKIS